MPGTLQEYIKYKTLHEQQIARIMSAFKSDRNRYETRREYIKSKKESFHNRRIKCVKCKKFGGTIFKETKDKYEAKCGNARSPCDLNIVIKKDKKRLIFGVLTELENDIQEKGETMLAYQMDYVYGIRSEEGILDDFDRLKREMQNARKIYEGLLTNYRSYLQYRKHDENIIKYRDELEKGIEEMKELLSKNPNDRDLEEATRIYENNVMVNIEALRNIYTPFSYINKDVDSFGNIKLLEYKYVPYRYEDLEVMLE